LWKEQGSVEHQEPLHIGAALFLSCGGKNMEKPQIQFINTLYETLFFIEDGDEIEIDIDGGTISYTCRYIDECHAQIGGRVYHIREFAEMMERNARTYRPVKCKEDGYA
jgi:hypothetical protein